MVFERGINHFDASPMYGRAEEHIGAWIKRNSKEFYLGCKTHERTKKESDILRESEQYEPLRGPEMP